MRFLTRGLLVVGASLTAGACGTGESGLAPTAATVAALPVERQAVRIVSGADETPVAGASVFFDGDGPGLSNEKGEVFPVGHLGARSGSAIDVQARGFLPRVTTLDADRRITLWPVADDAEAEAVRLMVYGPGDGVLQPPDSGPFSLSFLDASVDGSLAALWLTEASAFGARFGLRYQERHGFQYDWNEVAVRFGGGGCQPIPAWGLCRDSARDKIFKVLPAKASDPATIRRVLAAWFLSPNPLPGFMNEEAPEADLSPLEVRTIRMILQRHRPNRWPDTDR